MTVMIRRAVAEDAAALAALAAVTFPLACPPHTTEESKARFVATMLSEERFADYVDDDHRAVMIAEDAEGAAVGYTMVNFGEPADGDVRSAIRIRPTAELSKCYVLPGHHGAGVAGSLLSASFEVATTQGAQGIWLGVNEENERAQRFYAKNGFEHVGSKRFLVGETLEDDWVMERALP